MIEYLKFYKGDKIKYHCSHSPCLKHYEVVIGDLSTYRCPHCGHYGAWVPDWEVDEKTGEDLKRPEQ